MDKMRVSAVFSKINLSPWMHISTGIISIVVLSLLWISVCLLHNQLNTLFKLNQQIDQVSSEIFSFRQQQDQLAEYEQEKQQLSKSFSAFNHSRFNQETRIEDVKTVFQKWQALYRIETINLKFDSRTVYNQSLNLWKVPITVQVRVLKDHQFYALLNKIQKGLPGKIVMKRFTVKKTSDLTPSMLKQIIQGTRNINLFEGQIEFDWIHHESAQLD
jgi:hypothetical protein